MGLIGEVWADAGLHVDTGSFAEYSSALAGVETRVTSFAQAHSAALIGAGTAVIGVTAGVAAYGVTLAAGYEKTQLQLEGLLGSQEKAGEMMEWLSDFAATTPFEFPELADASAKLLSAGMDAKEYMIIVGDVAAGTNKSIDQVTEAFIDAQTGEWERLKELGISHFQVSEANYMQYGLTVADIGKDILVTYDAQGQQIVEVFDKNSREATNAALKNLSVEKFAGSMDKVAGSLSGKWSTIKDNINNALVDIVGFEVGEEKATGLYLVLQKLADVAIGLSGAFSSLSEPTQTLILVLGAGALAVGGLAIAIGLVGAASAIATPGVTAIAVSINAAIWPATLIVGTLALVAAGLYVLEEKTGLVSAAWQTLKDVFTISAYYAGQVIGWLHDWIVQKIDGIKTALDDMIPDSWVTGVTTIWNTVTSVIGGAGDSIHQEAEQIRQDHNNVGTSAQTAGGQVTGATGQMITGYNGAGASVLGMGANTLTATGQMTTGMNAAGGAATTMGGNIAGTVPAVNSLTGAAGSGTAANQSYAASFIYVANQASAAASAAISATDRIGAAIRTNISQVGELEALAGKWNTRAKLGITSSGGNGKGEGNVRIKTPANMMTRNEYNSRVANQRVYNNNVRINTVNNNGSSVQTSKVKSVV